MPAKSAEAIARKRASATRWKDEHPEQCKSTARVWLKAHPGYKTERSRIWRLTHPSNKPIRPPQKTTKTPKVPKAQKDPKEREAAKRAGQKAWRDSHREERVAYQKAWNDNRWQENNIPVAMRRPNAMTSGWMDIEERMNLIHMACLVRKAKSRAKKRGLEFDGLRRIIESPPPESCACCRRKFDRSGSNNRQLLPSLDRVNTLKGYTDENTKIICYRCNTLKSNATLDEIAMIAEYVKCS